MAHCTQYLRNLIIERKILSGNYGVVKLRKEKLDILEKVLSNMIKLSTENMKRPEWWPDDIIFLSTIDALRKEAEGAPMNRSWQTIVCETLASCNEFYRNAPLNLVKDSEGERVVMRKRRSSTPEQEEKRRMERTPLKVLTNNTTPTPTKLLCTPQKLEVTPTKVRKLQHELELTAVTIPHLPSQVDVSKVFNQPQINQTPVLPTNKVLIPVGKNDLMNYLNLHPKASIYKRSQSKDTLKYNYNIPFSSDLGRILLQRELYSQNAEKAEELEYYLKEQPVITKEKRYKISYNKTRKRHGCDHIYNFPKRQSSQGERYIQNLKKSLCKPVSVILKRSNIDKLKGCRDITVPLERLNLDLERIDIDKCLCKPKAQRDVWVVLERLKIDQFGTVFLD